jgi:predicted RNA methylase
MIIASDVLEVLGASRTQGNALTLPCQLDRKLYVQVNKVLEASGGKWNRSARAHVFTVDADSAIEQLMTTGTVTTDQEMGYFPTPAPVLDRLLSHAAVLPGQAVLEPSAGEGAIASAVAPFCDAVDCIEVDPRRAEKIRAGGYARAVTTGDFLAVSATPAYDRVVMNPPFGRHQDVVHVAHALGFLKPGGRLASVMALSVNFRQDKATAAFRDRVYRSGGVIEELPVDAFKVAGTGVRTVIAVAFA